MLLCSCGDNFDLERRLIIRMLYIERENGDYVVSVFEQMSEDTAGERICSRGKTFAQAMSGLSTVAGRHLLLSHTKNLLFGSNMSEREFFECAAVLAVDNEIPLEARVAVVSDSGDDAQTLCTSDEYSDIVRRCEDVMHLAKVNSQFIPITLKDVLARKDSGLYDVYVPVIIMKQGNAQLNGTLVFSGEKCAGKLNSEQTRSVLIINGESDVFYTNAADAEFKITEIKSAKKISYVNGLPQADINITVYARTTNKGENEKKALAALKEKFTDEFYGVTDILIKNYNCDILGFKTAAYLKSPKSYKNCEAEFFNTVKYNYSVKIITE